MNDSLIETLEDIFKKHDVLFWYNDKDEDFEDYESLTLNGVEKVKIENNEFEIKYRITHKKEGDKFLIYSNQSRPEDKNNWLLDLELAYKLFYTDQESILLQELGLDFYFKPLIAEHLPFFKSKERVAQLKELLAESDTEQDIKYKMLAVVFNSNYPNLNNFVLTYGSALANDNEKPDKDLERYQLKEFFWKEVEKNFSFHAEKPTIYDFLIEAFSFSAVFAEKPKVNNEAVFVLSMWKDSLNLRDNYDKLSEKIAYDLNVEGLLNEVDFEKIIEEDYFQLGDKRIIHGMIQRVLQNDIANDRLQAFVKERENKFWYAVFEPFYQCVSCASELQHKIKSYQYDFKEVAEGIRQYADSYQEIDFLYRKFILWYKKTNHDSILNSLAEEMEKLYVNTWLLPFNNSWQKVIDNLDKWPVKERFSQGNFFKTYVQPFLDKKQRVFVIISDALRYESGKEFTDLLLKENRYEAEIDAQLASLPSYTQLGMASLLPNREIAIVEGGDSVSVDGKNTIGINARKAILEEATAGKATAIQADEFMKMKARDEGREFIKPYDAIYIYHNTIDKTGDDKTTEDKLVEAVEEELKFLFELIKKIANVNGSNMLITSDHGFLYQYQPVDESDFMPLNLSAETDKFNRRFVLGKNLPDDPSVRSFTHQQLGLSSNGMVLIPKSINRLRVKGAGSKFVHGGASLQEVVTPVIRINKKRTDTVEMVDIDIIKSTDVITTNLLPISFIQDKPVSSNLLSRQIQAFIIAEDGTVLSDVFTYTFDSEEPNARQREVRHRFQLTALASGKYKNQRVRLLLEEPIPNSQRWTEYRKFYYTLNISFASDFDF